MLLRRSSGMYLVCFQGRRFPAWGLAHKALTRFYRLYRIGANSCPRHELITRRVSRFYHYRIRIYPKIVCDIIFELSILVIERRAL